MNRANVTRISLVLQDMGLRCVGLPATGGLKIQQVTGDARIYPSARQGLKVEIVARTAEVPAQLQAFPLSWAGDRCPATLQ